MTRGARLTREEVRAGAEGYGFSFCGITRAEPSRTLDAYLRWIDAGMHGTMGYMARPDRVARRRDLNVILPGARSMIVVGLDYRTASVGRDVLSDPRRGRIAAYAWGADYHDVMGEKLRALGEWLAGGDGMHPVPTIPADGAPADLPAAEHKYYVDTGAVLERSHAQESGFGFIGKNTMLIHPRQGSTFFLGEIITDAEFDAYDRPMQDGPTCGTCARCLQACPTDAFPAPHVLDARKCISYHTIENKGAIPADLRAKFGNWVFGCDVCQDVCPFQRFAPVTPERAFFPARLERAAPTLDFLLTMDDDTFKATYAGSPVMRAGWTRMIRNACIAAGNSGIDELVPLVERHVDARDAIVSEHARWAVERLQGR